MHIEQGLRERYQSEVRTANRVISFINDILGADLKKFENKVLNKRFYEAIKEVNKEIHLELEISSYGYFLDIKDYKSYNMFCSSYRENAKEILTLTDTGKYRININKFKEGLLKIKADAEKDIIKMQTEESKIEELTREFEELENQMINFKNKSNAIFKEYVTSYEMRY